MCKTRRRCASGWPRKRKPRIERPVPARPLADLTLAPAHLVQVQALLAQHAPGLQVWAYGSRVAGGAPFAAHECSDLDLVLRPGAGQLASSQAVGADDAAVAAAVQALQAGFEASALPMLVDVWAWQALPAAFHAQIEAAYVVLQPGEDLCGASAV